MPKSTDISINVPLTKFVRTYPFTQQNLVGDVVAPPVPSGIRGEYVAYGNEAANVDVSDFGGEKGEANVVDYQSSIATYTTVLFKLKGFVSQRSIDGAPAGDDPVRRMALNLTWGLKLRNEIRIATLAAANANTSTPANDWSADAATIVADINTGKLTFKAAFGVDPNYILLPDHVADEVAGQQDIASAIQTAAALQNGATILSQLYAGALPTNNFLGMKLLVASGTYISSAPGAATTTYGRCWGDDAYMFYVGSGGDSAGWARQFESLAPTVLTWRSNDPSGTYVMAAMERDIVEVTATAVHKFVDVT